MKIKVKKNPTTCVELSAFIGYPVKEWIRNPDGSMEVDIGADSLSDKEMKELMKKLEALQTHLVVEE